MLDGDEVYPIFASSEWDTPPSCDVCLEAIEGVTVLGEWDEYIGEWLID